MRLGLPQAVEIDLGIRPGDQLGAELRRQVPLPVPIDRIGAEVISAGKSLTDTPRDRPRSMAGRSRCAQIVQDRPFNSVPSKEIKYREKKMNSLSVKSISAKNLRSHRKSAPR